MERKSLLILIFMIILPSAILLGLFCYDYFFHPAYLSYVSACVSNGEQIIEEQGFAIAGSYTYNFSSHESEIYLNPEIADKKTLKHELCHARQATQHRNVGCANSIRFYMNELECYILQNF